MSSERPIRLLVINNLFPPDHAAGAAVFGDMCYQLVERGMEVTVRCAYPYYPEWKDKSGRNGFRIWRYEDHKVKVERYGLYIPKDATSLMQRLLYEVTFLLSLLRGIPEGRKYDVVLAYCPAVSSVAVAVLNKLLWRKPLWLNVQDLAAEAANASGLVKKRWLNHLLSGVQRWLFNRADLWSTISPTMAEGLAPLRKRHQPLLMMPNWLNASLSEHIQACGPKQQADLGMRPVRLLYAGNIGAKQNLLQLLKVLAASKADFRFKVHGNGARAAEVEEWLNKANDPRFEFGPFLDEKGFAQALHAADFFVITETPAGGASFMPSKLIPGIASGTPILAVSDPASPLGREVLDHELGPHYVWENAGEITHDILQPQEPLDSRHRNWMTNARARFSNYDRDALINRFAENLERLYGGEQIETDY